MTKLLATLFGGLIATFAFAADAPKADAAPAKADKKAKKADSAK